MKRLVLFTLLLLSAGTLFQSACAKAQVKSTSDSDWKYLSKDEDDGVVWETYYDAKSIKRTGSVVAVWLKQHPVNQTEEQRQRLIRGTIANRESNHMSTKGYDKYAYSQMLVEVDCNAKTGRNVSIKDFDEGGTLLGSDTKPGIFAPVRDGSMGALTLDAVCK